MRIDYKTRLELESVTWLKSFSGATGRPQTDIVNEALEQYRASLAPLPDVQDDRAAFTPPILPPDAREVPPEPQGGSVGFFGDNVARPETVDEQLARLTYERDSVHLMKDVTAAARREEFERLDADVRRLTAQQISFDLDNGS